MPAHPATKARPARATGAIVSLLAIVGASVAGGCAAESPIAAPPGTATAAPPEDAVASGVLLTASGVVAPILRATAAGAWVRTPCYRIAWVNGGTRVDHADIVLDPGHGGPELGAVGPTGLEEKTPNLAVASMARDQIRARGRTVLLTHSTDDYFLTVRTRAEIGRAVSPVLFLSIHHDSSGPPARKGNPGTHAIHQSTSAKAHRLGDLVSQEVADRLSRFDIEWSADDIAPQSDIRLDEKNDDYYGVLRYAEGVPAVIVESAYITNPPEEDLLRTDEFREAEAAGISAGIHRYLADPIRQTKGPAVVREPLPVGTPPDGADCIDPPM